MEKKPAGIIILAVLSFLSFVLFITGVFFSQATFSTIRNLTANKIYIDNMGAGAVIINLAFAAYHLTIGIGMLMLKNWARILYLVNTWIATIVTGLSELIFIVLTFVVGPGALLLFLIGAISLTINIFILRYLYKPEIANLFTLSSYNKSDSYSVPSQFGEVEAGEANLDNEGFEEPTISHIKVPATFKKTDTEAKTQLMEAQPSVMAMLFKDMGNGKYKHFDITKTRVSIGRSKDNDIVISDDITIGRQHAQILFRQGKFWIHDLASTNGTFVNGKKIEKHDLIEGDEIHVGKTKFIFKCLNA